MLEPVLASQIYALSQNSKCSGEQSCHWCGGPCGRLWLHDDPPPVPCYRTNSSARKPANPYICCGCWLWRRKKITAPYLSSGMKDSQTPNSHSWWITESGAWALRPVENDSLALWKILASPPLRFVLCFVTSQPLASGRTDFPAGISNLIHLAVANDHKEIKASTELHFTINNIPHSYTVYELEEATKHGADGKAPGVRELFRLLGQPQAAAEAPRQKGAGRPAGSKAEDAKVLSRMVKSA